MALPQINTFPSYATKIPSSGQEVTFRPYLVKEEKVLMIAMETQDPKQILRAVQDTLSACVLSEISTELTTFDIEYLFLKVRSKSVGETSTINYKCAQCEVPNEVTINLDEVQCEMTEAQSTIPLTDKARLRMQYPTYDKIVDIVAETKSPTGMTFAMIAACMNSLETDDELFLFADEPRESVQQFIDTLTNAQLKMVKQWVDAVPKVTHELQFTCKSCGHENKEMLEGLNSFF